MAKWRPQRSDALPASVILNGEKRSRLPDSELSMAASIMVWYRPNVPYLRVSLTDMQAAAPYPSRPLHIYAHMWVAQAAASRQAGLSGITYEPYGGIRLGSM